MIFFKKCAIINIDLSLLYGRGVFRRKNNEESPSSIGQGA